MDDRTLILLLRLVHILAGVFWVGAALVLSLFLAPTARHVGHEAGPFMRELMIGRRLSHWLWIAATLTVLSGLAMYWRFAALSGGAFAGTRHGIALGVGGAAAILAAVLGSAIGGAAARRMAAMGAQLQRAGTPPEPTVAAAMQRLQRRARVGSAIAAGLLVVATLAMAGARYF